MVSRLRLCTAMCAALVGIAPVCAMAGTLALDSTTGTLPIGANGVVVMTVNVPSGATSGTVTFSGPITEGSTTINTDGSTVIGSSTTPAPTSSVLTVNGDVSVLGTATVGANCSTYGVGTIAQDGTGKLVSCQSSTAGGAMVQTWQIAAGKAPGLDPGWPDVIRCAETGTSYVENLPLVEVNSTVHQYESPAGTGYVQFANNGAQVGYNGWGLGGANNLCNGPSIQAMIAAGWAYTAYSPMGNPAYTYPPP